VKVSRDGAEVTSTGRLFHMRALATRKVRRAIVGSLTAGTNKSLDEEDRSLCQDGMSAIDVNCRMYCIEGHRHRKPDKSAVRVENNPFRHLQPMEAVECICDVVRSTEMEYQLRHCVLRRLESVEKVGREADQCAITIVESTQNQSSNKQMEERSTREDGGMRML